MTKEFADDNVLSISPTNETGMSECLYPDSSSVLDSTMDDSIATPVDLPCLFV
jgi:hypothetical protein